MSEHRGPSPADRPQPSVVPSSGWPDVPGWTARPPEPGPSRVANPTAGRPSEPRTPNPADGAAPGDGQAGRPPVTQRPPVTPPRVADQRAGSFAGAARPMAATATVSRGPRRARLTVRRVDPWSVLRFSFLASIVLLVVFIVAVMVLYGVLAGMHVFSTINDQLHSLTGTDTSGGLHVNFSFGRVLGITLVIGVVNVVLFTALATLGAFVYNLVSDLVGGIEVVLSERE